jgi:hypothetical protein
VLQLRADIIVSDVHRVIRCQDGADDVHCRSIAGRPQRSRRTRPTSRCRAPAITLPVAGERELRLDLFRGWRCG